MAAPIVRSGLATRIKYRQLFNVSWGITTQAFHCSAENTQNGHSRSGNSVESVGKHDASNCLARSFRDMMDARRHQASRSLLVRLASGTALDSLLQYCNSQGKVEHHFTYFQKAHYVVIEFNKPETVTQVIEKATTPDSKFNKYQTKEQLETRFLSFSKPARAKSKTQPKAEVVILNKDVSNAGLLHSLAQAQSVNEQLDLLVREQELTDSETRLRFLVCCLVEEAFQCILPDSSLHPFGSSINGFGRRSCDVDMYLDRGTAHGVIPLKQGRNKYKLSYDRQSANSERVATQSTLFTLAEFLERHVPQCSFVHRILNARCPLVKFKHQATGLSCDLTGDNRIALMSSEMLYIFGHLDPRVRPVVFMVRHWARLQGITNNNPGYWITNYPLTLLVIFFLQTRPVPVLPALSKISKFVPFAADSVDDEFNLVFTDTAKIPSSSNTESAAELLREFFHFCLVFDFNQKAISIYHGSSYAKPDKMFPFYIENPLESKLNTSKNVSSNLLDRLRRLSQDALRTMDNQDFDKPSRSDGELAHHSWGLGALLMGPLFAKKGKPRSVAMEKKLGAVFQSLKKSRSFSTLQTGDIRTTPSCSDKFVCTSTKSCKPNAHAVSSSQHLNLNDNSLQRDFLMFTTVRGRAMSTIDSGFTVQGR